VLLWYFFMSIMIGSLIYIIVQFINKSRMLTKKLEESEKSYRDLAKKYAALESSNQQLEKQFEAVKTGNKNSKKNYERPAVMGELSTIFGHPVNQALNSLSLLIQDVREAHEFGEIDDQYINNFTRESMLQINQMSRSINEFRKINKPNEEKTLI